MNRQAAAFPARVLFPDFNLKWASSHAIPETREVFENRGNNPSEDR